MDKKTFINELKQALSVLQEEELNDIVSEYEQHIDMKQERGLTEEEAIADFGSLDELTAEILEAYHVRADYAAESRRRRRPALGESGRSTIFQWIHDFFLRVGSFWKQLLLRSWKRGADWWSRHRMFRGRQEGEPEYWLEHTAVRELESENVCEMGSENVCGLLQEDDGEVIQESSVKSVEETENGVMQKAAVEAMRKTDSGMMRETRRIMNEGKTGDRRTAVRERTGAEMTGRARNTGIAARVLKALGGLCRGTGRLAVSGASFCIRVLFWGIRMAWNAGWIGFALCCGFFGLCCLYGLGVLMVLLLQGYPLAGVTMGCLGLVMCSFSAAFLGLTLLKKRTLKEGKELTEGEGRQLEMHRTPSGEETETGRSYQNREEGQHA